MWVTVGYLSEPPKTGYLQAQKWTGLMGNTGNMGLKGGMYMVVPSQWGVPGYPLIGCMLGGNVTFIALNVSANVTFGSANNHFIEWKYHSFGRVRNTLNQGVSGGAQEGVRFGLYMLKTPAKSVHFRICTCTVQAGGSQRGSQGGPK